MAKKQVKEFVQYHEVRFAVETNQEGRVFAVNGEQYRELAPLEGQSVIQGDGYVFIEKVKERLKKVPRIRKNYIVTTYKQKKKKDPINPEQFAAFCVDLGIWERTPDGGIAVKPGPLRYTTAEVVRRFKERQKWKK